MKKKYSPLLTASLAGVLLIGCLAAAGCGGSDSTASGDLIKVTRLSGLPPRWFRSGALPCRRVRRWEPLLRALPDPVLFCHSG